MKTYYKLWFRLDQLDSYLIWYSDDEDRVLLKQAGNIRTFGDEASLMNYATTLGLSIQNDQPELNNLDLLQKWLHKPRKETIDCVEFLNGWNLFDDMATSLGKPKLEAKLQTGKIYDKLFWGNNLPAMTPPGKHYTRIWSNREVEKIEKVLSYGLELFRGQVAII